MDIQVEFPPKLQCLFAPKRKKVLYGGRGAGRSWGIARALLILGTMRGIRVLCVRELQNSIAESVHKVLSDQIVNMGLEKFYDVQVGKILGTNGTSFSFEGIKNNTTKIKSYEGIDYCWVEEGNKVSKTSWEILVPTIRAASSEIWISFNPELATDYTYKEFVLNADPEDSVVVYMTYKDNPWFPEVLRKEAEYMRERDPEAYDNVWLGHCRQALHGAVFAKELRRASAENRICRVPWDRETAVDAFWDLGHRDMTAIWFAQRVAMQWRVLGYFEDSQEDIHYYLRHCQAREFTLGTMYLPHDAKAQRLGQKRTIEKIVRGAGFRVQIVPKAHRKANAINAARTIFPSCWFDERECSEGINRLRHYTYSVSAEGNFSEEPLHDENSNGADAFMTMGQAMKSNAGIKSVSVGKKLEAAKESLRGSRTLRTDEPAALGLGWMR